MSELITGTIEQGYILLNDGKIEQAFQLVLKTEKQENLTPGEMLQNQLLKGTLLIFLGRLEDALKIGEEAFQKSEALNRPGQTVEAIHLKFGAIFSLGRLDELLEDINYCKKLLKRDNRWTSFELENCKGMVAYMKGSINHQRSEYELALKNLQKSLTCFENSKFYSFMVPQLLTFIGDTYHWKGELEQARQAHEKALKISKGSNPLTKLITATSQYCLGKLLHDQGKLDLALEKYKISLNLFEMYWTPFYVGVVYDRIILLYLNNNDYEMAKNYLAQFQHFDEKMRKLNNKTVYDANFYKISQARILKASTRTRDRAKAEKILKDLIKLGEKNVNSPIKLSYIGQIHYALLLLCDLYFTELNLTNDLRILDDIDPLIEKLIKESERTKSYSLLANAYMLKGKIALLRMNMGEARRYLTQAQNIAEPKGLQILARAISEIHDKLLEKLDEWNNLEKKKTSISERFDLALLDEIIDRIQNKSKKIVDGKELEEEEPVLLLILNEGGTLLFSYPFAKEWERDEELFGGFMSAFTSFSEEFFSQELDRAKFGEFTVLMKIVFNFTICYLFKGQSYLALKKLAKFARIINENDSITETFQKYQNSSQLLEIRDFPFLKSFITEVFVKSE